MASDDIKFDIDIGVSSVNAAKAALAACESAITSLDKATGQLASGWIKDFDTATGATNKARAAIDATKRSLDKVKAAYAAVKAAPGKVADAAKKAFESIKAAPGKAVDAAKSAFAAVVKVVRNPFTSVVKLGGGIKDLASKGFGALRSVVAKGLPAVKAFAGKGLDAVRNAAKAAGPSLLSAGKAGLALAGGAVAAGLSAIVAGLVKVGQTTIARDNLKATLDQVTKGRGAEALKQLDKLAKGLNKSTEDVTADFVALRKKGLSNIDSAKLIKLKADLEAVGVDAATAEAEVAKVAAAIKSGANADQAIKKAAKAYGAQGDGANAAAKKAYTLEGAIQRVKLMIEQGLAKVAEKLGPKITGLIDKIAKGFESLDSADVEKYIDNIGEAIDALGPVVEAAFAVIGAVLKVGIASFGALSNAASFVQATVTVAAQYIGQAWTAVAPVITAAVESITAAYNSVVSTVSGMLAAVTGFVTSFSEAGKNLIISFAKGIVSGVSAAVDAAKQAGTAAKDSLKATLGISSPSKVAQEIAANFTTSFADTVEDAPAANMNDMVPQSPEAKPSKSASPSITVNVNVAQTNATAEDIAIAVETGVRRALAS